MDKTVEEVYKEYLKCFINKYNKYDKFITKEEFTNILSDNIEELEKMKLFETAIIHDIDEVREEEDATLMMLGKDHINHLRKKGKYVKDNNIGFVFIDDDKEFDVINCYFIQKCKEHRTFY